MEEAFCYCNIMSSEANLRLQEYLEHMALTIRFSKNKNKVIHLAFSKVWVSKKKDKVDEKYMDLSFKKTRVKLLQILNAAWEDKAESGEGYRRRKGPIIPDHLKTIEKFASRGKRLCELLLCAVVLCDYCLNYTTSSHGDEVQLIELVRDLFKNETSFASCWRLLDYLLRMKVAKDEETLNRVRVKPSAGKTILLDCVYSKHPESVRDWSVRTIHNNRSRRGDLFFTGSITEKDASIWAFRVMSHLYCHPDKSLDDTDKLPLLYLKKGTRVEDQYEKERHQLLKGDGSYSFRSENGDLESIPTSKKDTTFGPFYQGVWESLGFIPFQQARKVMFQFESEDEESDGDMEEEKEDEDENNDGKLDDCNDDTGEMEVGTNETRKMQEDGTTDSTKMNQGSLDGSTMDDHMNQLDKDIQASNINHSAAQIDMALMEKPHAILKFSKFAETKDLEDKSFVLNYLTPDRVKCSFELGKLDHIHFTRLEQVPHLLSTKPSSANKNKRDQGCLFVPRKETHFTYEYGIFRCGDPVMKVHREVLQLIDFDLILQFLARFGFRDGKRDHLEKTTLRVSVGSANHNYEHRLSDKDRRKTKWRFLRDLPKNDCSVQDIINFHPKLATELGKLLDFSGKIFDGKMASVGTPILGYLDDAFIWSVFTQPFLKTFNCKACRYPCFDLVCMDAEEPDMEKEGAFHTDGKNGTTPGNDISSTTSFFFRAKRIVDCLLEEGLSRADAKMKASYLLKGKTDVPRLKRLYLICYTRSAHEHFRDNEAVAETLKKTMKKYRDLLDSAYKPFGGSFARPDQMWFQDSKAQYDFDTTNLLLTEMMGTTPVEAYRLPPSYAGEVYCSSGMSILYEANCILADKGLERKKMLEVYIVAISMGSWFIFYHAGVQLLLKLESIENIRDTNLTLLMLQTMVDLFGTWRGGPYHRGRPTSVDLMEHYKEHDKVETAVGAMDKYLSIIESRPNLGIFEWKEHLMKMVEALPGVGLHYGMRLGFYSGLTGIVTTNLHNCFRAYPIEDQGSAKTISEQNDTFQAELDAMLDEDDGRYEATVQRVKEIGLRSDFEGYRQTVRLVSSFCGLEARENWIENLFCDGIGPNRTKFDFVFPGQCIFWFHPLTTRRRQLHEMKFATRKKEWGSQIWSDVRKFF